MTTAQVVGSRPETVDPTCEPTERRGCHSTFSDEDTYLRRTVVATPLDTEADLIAGASLIAGAVYRRPMIQLVDDHSRGDGCLWCLDFSDSYLRAIAACRRTDMAEYGVTYDPTIRF